MNKHERSIMDDFIKNRHIYEKLSSVIKVILEKIAEDNGISVVAVETRVKAEKSLEGKLERKGYKYNRTSDITDLVGARIVTFYGDEVEKLSAIVQKYFTIDWFNSTDKRQRYEYDRFGYMSLHYICQIPSELYHDNECPEINEIKFELQMKTALQHVWASIQHDIGYKTNIEIPKRYLRDFSCLAGLLEIADKEFNNIHREINDYRRKVSSMLINGEYNDVLLDGDTFRRYIELEPFIALNKRIAAINQAEIHKSDISIYLPVLEKIGIKSLGEIEKMKNAYSDTAYQLALSQIGGTDLDIISSSLAIHYLCIVYALDHGGSIKDIKEIYDILYGERERNEHNAKRIIEQLNSITRQ